ncbi:hypothetical protein FPRO04_07962 [Fusarium proliferatum]|nr:hypothetical protein FPRO03_13715 [Fusarium proliferatum]KAG4276238.1 hypothetical protein FPRO04_07962 [Fusarium proliferatum]
MGLGVLPDRHLSDVPGTSFLNEKGISSSLETAPEKDHSNLKHDSTGKIVLVPQPSDDPNDPLNWPRWKKEMFTVSIIVGCGCVGAIGPLLGPALVPIAEEFDVPLQRFSLGFTGSLLIALAFGNLFCNSLAMMIGKRPVYLITTLGLLCSTIWTAVAKDFISLALSRAIQGFCMSPMEALVPASISDIWFVHQRGFRNAVFNLGVLGGINLASPIAGAIIDRYGYKTCLWAMAGAFGLQLILTFFFMPETAYKRSTNPDTLVSSHVEGHSAVDDKKECVSEVENKASVCDNAPIPEPRSFICNLRPWSGYYDASGFWYSMFAPFKMLGSPVVIWGCFQLTICMSWLVLLASTASQIFTQPPYNFTVAQVGLTNLSSFVGTFIATALAGIMVDGLATFMARRNEGIYEPEFRLPILVLLTTLGGSGFFGYGQSLSNGEPWPIPVIVCLGMINLGVQFGIVGLVSYVVDSHRREAVEAYAMMSFTKNVFAFGMSFYMNDWIEYQGVRDAFFVIGGITMAISMATIPIPFHPSLPKPIRFGMGDPFSIATGAAGLFSLGITVCDGLHTYFSAIKDRKEDLAIVTKDLALFKFHMVAVQSIASKLSHRHSLAIGGLRRSLTDCEMQLKSLQILLDELMPTQDPSLAKEIWRRQKLIARYPFDRKKLVQLQEYLTRANTTLSSFMQALNLDINMRISDELEALRTSLEALDINTQATLRTIATRLDVNPKLEPNTLQLLPSRLEDVTASSSNSIVLHRTNVGGAETKTSYSGNGRSFEHITNSHSTPRYLQNAELEQRLCKKLADMDCTCGASNSKTNNRPASRTYRFWGGLTISRHGDVRANHRPGCIFFQRSKRNISRTSATYFGLLSFFSQSFTVSLTQEYPGGPYGVSFGLQPCHIVESSPVWALFDLVERGWYEVLDLSAKGNDPGRLIDNVMKELRVIYGSGKASPFDVDKYGNNAAFLCLEAYLSYFNREEPLKSNGIAFDTIYIGFSELFLTVIMKDHRKLQAILAEEDSLFTLSRKDLYGRNILNASCNWPDGLKLLLQRQDVRLLMEMLSEPYHFSDPLYYALIYSVVYCHAPDQWTECDGCTCYVAAQLLLEADCKVTVNYTRADILAYCSLKARRLFFEHLKDRRQRLRNIALSILPESVLCQYGVTTSHLPDKTAAPLWIELQQAQDHEDRRAWLPDSLNPCRDSHCIPESLFEFPHHLQVVELAFDYGFTPRDENGVQTLLSNERIMLHVSQSDVEVSIRYLDWLLQYDLNLEISLDSFRSSIPHRIASFFGDFISFEAYFGGQLDKDVQHTDQTVTKRATKTIITVISIQASTLLTSIITATVSSTITEIVPFTTEEAPATVTIGGGEVYCNIGGTLDPEYLIDGISVGTSLSPFSAFVKLIACLSLELLALASILGSVGALQLGRTLSATEATAITPIIMTWLVTRPNNTITTVDTSTIPVTEVDTVTLAAVSVPDVVTVASTVTVTDAIIQTVLSTITATVPDITVTAEATTIWG